MRGITISSGRPSLPKGLSQGRVPRMTSLFSFSSPVDIDIRLSDEHDRKTVEVKTEGGSKEVCPVYFDGETLKGTVRSTMRVILTVQVIVQTRNAKKLMHDGIKIEFIGSIGGCQMTYDRTLL